MRTLPPGLRGFCWNHCRRCSQLGLALCTAVVRGLWFTIAPKLTLRRILRTGRGSLLLRLLLLLVACRSRGPLQIVNSRLNLVDQAHVFVIAHNPCLGVVIGL